MMSNSQTKFYTMQIDLKQSVICVSEISAGFGGWKELELIWVVCNLVQLLWNGWNRKILRKKSSFLCNLGNVLSLFKTIEAEYPDTAILQTKHRFHILTFQQIFHLGIKENLLLGKALLQLHQCIFIFSVHLRKVWFYDSCGLLKTSLIPGLLWHLLEVWGSGLLCIRTVFPG